MESYVYILMLKDESAFKIGKSNNPYKRLSILRKYYSFNIEKSYMLKCKDVHEAFDVENILHKMFSKDRAIQEYDGGTEFFNTEVFALCNSTIETLINRWGITKSVFSINTANLCTVDEDSIRSIMNRLGTAVKRHRLLLNITQGTLAKLCNVSVQAIRRVETGKNTSTELLVSVFKVLGLEERLDNLCIEIPLKKRASK